MLKSIDLVREIAKTIDLNARSAEFAVSRLSAATGAIGGAT